MINISLSKPPASDWLLSANGATTEQLEQFNAAVENAAHSAGAEDWCDLVSGPGAVWRLRVDGPYLAVSIAYNVGKAMNVTVGLSHIGD